MGVASLVNGGCGGSIQELLNNLQINTPRPYGLVRWHNDVALHGQIKIKDVYYSEQRKLKL